MDRAKECDQASFPCKSSSVSGLDILCLVSNLQSNNGRRQELVHNRVPYLDRGWCIGETNWTSMRSSPKRLPDVTKDGYCRAPMSPEVFEERQERLVNGPWLKSLKPNEDNFFAGPGMYTIYWGHTRK